MHPVLLQIGPITIYTYGLLVASGFLLGITWAARLAKKEGINPQYVYDTAFWIILAAIIGSRLSYITWNAGHFLQNPLDTLKLWEGGLDFFGGLLGAVIAVLICNRTYKMNLWHFADIAAPGLALGHAIGRIGCFFAGCCYGIKTSVPWAVTFTDIHSIAPTGIPLHPTQAYDSLNEFVIFAILTAIRPYRRFHGQIWWLWVGMYAAGRFVIEFYRGDTDKVWLGGAASVWQLITIGVMILAVVMYFNNKKRYPIT